MPNKAADFLDELDRQVAEAKEVQNATSALELAVHHERSLLNSALETAKIRLQMEDKLTADPILKRHYVEARENLKSVEQELRGDGKIKPLGSVSEQLPINLPNFAYPVRHANAAIANAIEAAIDAIAIQRKENLRYIFSEISKDIALKRHFENSISRLGAAAYYSKLANER